MKHQACFRVTLLEDVILPSQSGTVGHNPGLAHLPGAVLLGIAANRWYRRNPDPDAATGWRLFHSGHVCFSDGLPVLGEELGYPTPLCLHRPKNESQVQVNGNEEKVEFQARNFAVAQAESDSSGMQWETITTGHLTTGGTWFQGRASLRMKTAIDPDKGRAAESQLFSYHSLDAGQEFEFSIACESHADLDLLEELIEGTARIGRSRTAEYGSVEIKRAEAGAGVLPECASREDCALLVWLLSDVALVNEWGAPTLEPKPAYLGLDDGFEFDAGRSFLRTRKYSPFNAKRQCRDPERMVLVRGSVLCFSGAGNTDRPSVGLHIAGLHREQGLGRMICNPKLLANAEMPLFRIHDTEQTAAKQSATIPKQNPGEIVDTPLLAMARRRRNALNAGNDAEKVARAVFHDLLEALDRHRAWAGLRRRKPIEGAPGRSQWGRIKEAASRLRFEPQDLWREVFDRGPDNQDSAGIVSRRSGWGLALGPNEYLADLFFEQMKEHRESPALGEMLGRLAALGLTAHWSEAVSGERRESNLGEGAA